MSVTESGTTPATPDEPQPMLTYKVAIVGAFPDRGSASADEDRTEILRAIEAALLPLQRKGIYMSAMYYTTEKGGRVHERPAS